MSEARQQLMTFEEAANDCHCNPKTLRRAQKRGELLAIRLGTSAKSDRIHPADLDAYQARKRLLCQSSNVKTEAIKLPSVSAEERCAKLLGSGRFKMRGNTSDVGSRRSKTLRLVESQKGR